MPPRFFQRSPFLAAALAGALAPFSLLADTVLFQDQSGNFTSSTYDDVRQSLDLVYDMTGYRAYPNSVGSGHLEAGTNPAASEPATWDSELSSRETEAIGTFRVLGASGNASVTFQFLYDDGAYNFNFGYFEVNSGLDAIAARIGDGVRDDREREAFAELALNPAGGTYRGITVAPHDVVDVFSDTGNTPGALYTTATPNGRADFISGDDGGSFNPVTVTTQIAVGKRLAFFIIPDNTRAAFLSSPGSFDLLGAGNTAWPLTSYNVANPDSRDQLFSFAADSRAPGADTTLLFTWEDIERDPSGGSTSDQDFNDLHFTVTNLLPEVIPEADSVLAILLPLALLTSSFAHRFVRAVKRCSPPKP